MAYTHSKYMVEMQQQQPKVSTSPGTAPTVDVFGTIVDVTGIVGEWSPGFVPHLIKAFSVQKIGIAQTEAAAWNVRFTHVKGAASTATNVANIIYPTTVTTLGVAVFYVPTFRVEVLPGELIRATVSTAAAADATAKIMLYVEPRWEEAANVTQMVLTTGKPADA